MTGPTIATDQMDPARAAALYATLRLTRDATAPLIPFGHWVYFWNAQPPAALGRDGHPSRKGDVIPATELPRRMWAGGRLQFARDLVPGQPAQKATFSENVVRKTGRSGPLGFVTLRHEISQNGRLAVTEWQDIVYRPDLETAPGSGPDPAPDAPPTVPPRAPTGAERIEEQRYSTTLLFRYSALTFNGHRIHYDLEYCRDVEGYPGLVVHGPLLAQQLMLMAQTQHGGLREFRFRATSPLFHTETAKLCQNGNRLWVAGPDGRLCMEATAS